MKEEDVLSQGITILIEKLTGIPFLKDALIEQKIMPGKTNQADVIFSIPGKNYDLVIEARLNGQPRYARSAVNALLRIRNDNPKSVGVLIAPFITEQAARICEEADIGYIDLSGNCRLVFDKIFILNEGQPNKYITRRTLSSLYSPKSERILRVLLAYPYQPWRTQELAKKATTSLGLVSYVKQQLEDREWIQISADGFALVKPESLLNDWRQNYSYKRNIVSDYYSLLSPSDIEKTLAEIYGEFEVVSALTGFSAANHYAPMVRNQRTMFYLSGNFEKVVKKLGLKPVTSGANVSIYRPYDEGVFIESKELDGILIASPVQVFLDLAQFRGRGEEALEILYKEVIEKRWLEQKTIISRQ